MLCVCFIQFVMIFGFVYYEPLEYEGYVYPTWANALGWMIACSSTACIPGIAVYQIIRTPGPIREVRASPA